MMRILVFDNYDSFTYNLVHLVKKISDASVEVYRNDQIALEEMKHYDKILLSPGPGIPKEAGLLLPLIEAYGASKSILGVCLGHQAIGEVYGGELINLETVYHGVATPVHLVNDNEMESEKWKGIYKDLPAEFPVGRYHSWVIKKESFPDELIITAEDDNGYVMGLAHRNYDVQGVQFHPESVLTPGGEIILRNWLKR